MSTSNYELSINCSTDEAKEGQSQEFELVWSNLSYRLYPSKLSQFVGKLKGHRHSARYRDVLQNCSGTLRSGRLTAILGPSGSGKSTLVECLIGKKVTNVKGEICLVGTVTQKSISYLPQKDQLCYELSVRESLTFAYQLQVIARGKCALVSVDVKNHVNILLCRLGLRSCADQMIMNVSNGQKRRLSIAQELISSPDILMLDEPSSGLDSSSCHKLIKLLLSLATQLSIIITVIIHQASLETFNLFHDIYTLSNGQIMFSGTPDQVVPILTFAGIKLDPFINPADCLINIAAGDYGTDVIAKLIQQAEKMPMRSGLKLYNSKQSKTFIDCVISNRGSFPEATRVLTKRSLVVRSRHKELHCVEAVIVSSFVILIASLFQEYGKYDGCLPYDPINNLSEDGFTLIYENLNEVIFNAISNIGSFIIILSFITIYNLLRPCVSLPMYADLYEKECFNGWFPPSAYFVAQILAELPFCFTVSFFVSFGHYYFTSQPLDRYMNITPILITTILISYLCGMLLAIINMDNLLSSTFSVIGFIMPALLLSGFFIRIKSMPVFFQFVSNLNYFRYIFEGTLVAVLGLNRCEHDADLFSSLNESRGQLGVFLNSMFNIARKTVDKLSTPDESKILAKQTMRVEQSILDELSLININNGSSILLRRFDLTDDLYIQSIWKLTVLMLPISMLIFLTIRLRSQMAA